MLIDQDAIKSGAAADGQPWRYYDLGHGLCMYDFFDTCPHRMACAKCSFYVPKGSSLEQILEGKANLLRMKQELALTRRVQTALVQTMQALHMVFGIQARYPELFMIEPSHLQHQQRGQNILAIGCQPS